ncbi:MAG: cation diffusion facilitator family transporter [Actinomycetota bacterium]
MNGEPVKADAGVPGPAAGHGHQHGAGVTARHRRPLTIVLGISASLLVVEVIGAVISGSLALLADAAHMLTDVGGLSLALIAAVLAQRPATLQRTWGYRRAEVLAAAGQAAVLLAVGVFVLIEAIRRLFEPPQVASGAMIAFGLIGLFGNALSILLLSRIQADNLNTRAAFLEVVNDALGSVVVLVAAVIIATTGWARADAVASLLIGGLILPRMVMLLRDTIDVLLEGTPKGVDLAEVRAHILGVDRVHDLHDLHASTVATDLPILTAHVVVDSSCFLDGHLPQLLDELQRCLAGHFDVAHSTFQFEPVGHTDHEHPAHA